KFSRLDLQHAVATGDNFVPRTQFGDDATLGGRPRRADLVAMDQKAIPAIHMIFGAGLERNNVGAVWATFHPWRTDDIDSLWDGAFVFHRLGRGLVLPWPFSRVTMRIDKLVIVIKLAG